MSDLYFLSFFVKKLHYVYGMIVYYLQIHIHYISVMYYAHRPLTLYSSYSLTKMSLALV